MDNYELYQERLRGSGKIPRSRQIDNKIKTFKNALGRSYNSQATSMGDKKFQSLITGIPTNPLIARRNFATLKDNGCEVGDEIYWEENDSFWLITAHDDTERAIFQGHIEKALYELRWKDPKYDRIYSARACAKGPDQVTIEDGVKHSIFFDNLTDSLHLIVSAKVEGVDLLKRYFYLMIDGRKWHVEVADRITKENLVVLELKEEPINRHEDTEDLVGGQIEDTFTIGTALDESKEYEIGESINLQPYMFKRGRLITDAQSKVLVKGAEYQDGFITFLETGVVEVTVIYEEYELIEKILVSVVESLLVERPQTLKILGNGQVNTLMTEEYEIVTNNSDIDGKWKIDSDYFKVIEQDGLRLKVSVRNKTGKTTVSYSVGEEEVKKVVNIIPLFGRR